MRKRITAVILALCLLMTCACADDIVFSAASDAWQTAAENTVKTMTGRQMKFTVDGDTVTAEADGMTPLIAVLNAEGQVVSVQTGAQVSLSAMASDTSPVGVAIVMNVLAMAEAEGREIDLNDTVSVLSALTDAVRAADVDENGTLETALACDGHRLHISVQTKDIGTDAGTMLWTVTYYP